MSSSETPPFGTSVRAKCSISAMAVSQAWWAQRMARISSGPFTARARSVTTSPSSTSKPAPFEGAEAVDHDLVDGEAAVVAGVGAHHLVHLTCEGAGVLCGRVAADVVEEGGAGAEFGHERVEGHEEGGVLVLPHHHVAVGAEEAGPERVVAVPELHVRRVGGVADVERVEHEEPADVAGDQRIGQPLPAVAAHRGEVGQREARRLPLAEGELGRPDFHAVVVVRGAVAEGRALRGVDLAAVAVGLVHERGSPFGSKDRGGAGRGFAETEGRVSLSALHRPRGGR